MILRKRKHGNKGRARPPSFEPNPFHPLETRKILVLEALRDNGGMTRQGLLDYLNWDSKMLAGPGASILKLLELEGKIYLRGASVNGRPKPTTMYYADPDITEQMLKPKEER